MLYTLNWPLTPAGLLLPPTGLLLPSSSSAHPLLPTLLPVLAATLGERYVLELMMPGVCGLLHRDRVLYPCPTTMAAPVLLLLVLPVLDAAGAAETAHCPPTLPLLLKPLLVMLLLFPCPIGGMPRWPLPQ